MPGYAEGVYVARFVGCYLVHMAGEETAIGSDRVALAIFALLAAERHDRVTGDEPLSVEAVLGDAGFSPAEVATLTNGNYETVKTRMRRARAAGKSS